MKMAIKIWRQTFCLVNFKLPEPIYFKAKF